ncbi:MAG: M48 family metalloprotease [Alphaproteobacteria bacterium]|nr:M48 family metalloprotease [Alphaproteobacteria bacterium]
MIKKIFIFVLFFCLSWNAYAISLISDEETESWLYDILMPIFRAASLPLDRNYIHIVKDDSLNAFVGDKNHMFIHTGTLVRASNSNEIEGVLAHETGHILGGHILRLKIKMQDLQKATLASLLAAAGAAAASGRGDAAIAVVLGAQSTAINAMTAYQMSEERAADETAVLLLRKNNKSVAGLKNFMGKIQHTNRLQGIEESAYFRTHPITSERISFFDDKLKQEKNPIFDTQMDHRFRRIQTKLFAYLAPLPAILKRYPLEDQSIQAKIAHAVYYMRQKNISQALKYTDELIASEPNNPYFWELKAQALFETGRIKEAVQAYQETLNLKPESELFKLSYAEAVLASEPNRTDMEKLIPMLEQTSRKHVSPASYLYLGQIYAQLGQDAMADYFAAEYNHAIGETALAQKMLTKALKKPLRSDIKLRAEDLKAKLEQDKKKNSLF